MTIIITRCEGCHRVLNKEIEGIHTPSNVMDYFCGPACFEIALDRVIDPRFASTAEVENDKQVLDYVNKLGRGMPTDFQEKICKEQIDEWRFKKKYARETATDDLKRQIDKTYMAILEEQWEQKEKDWERECDDMQERIALTINLTKAEFALEEDRQRKQEKIQREEERKQRELEKAAEKAQREWDKDFEAAEAKHEKFLTEEAFQEAIKPKVIPEHIRFEHTHILGPSGSGKTSLIQQLILDDICTCAEFPAYIVIDPKGLMVERLSRLEMPQHVIFIDPTKHPLPALDLFHQPELNVDEQQRNRIRNQLIETFAYIFSTADARLTQRQSIPFAYVVRLVFSMGGNIDTLMDILEDSPKERRFYPHMQKLGERDAGARRFFENDFYTTGFSETRQQIKTRLYEIVALCAQK